MNLNEMRSQEASRHARCPICFGMDTHHLWAVTAEEAAQNFVLSQKQPQRFAELASHIERLWKQRVCAVVQCDACGFCFSDPYVAGDTIFYTLAYDRSRYPEWKWEYQETLAALCKVPSRNRRLLEVGAGDGAFVRRVSEVALPKANIVCTEFSDYGRHQIESAGITCFSRDIRDLSRADLGGNFDIACLFQVLEHMDSLDALFGKLHDLLKSNSSLFIAVPNPRRISFNERNGGLLDMPPNHIGRWNELCFEVIGKRAGFELIEYKYERVSIFAIARQFAIYRFLRRAQIGGSIENRIQALDSPILHKLMRIFGVALNSLTALPALSRWRPDMGGSLWAHLAKK